MGLSREEIFLGIDLERQYQVERWGTETDKKLSKADWLLILENELEKAKNHRMGEMVGYPTYSAFGFGEGNNLPNVKARLIKIATVCVAALENLP